MMDTFWSRMATFATYPKMSTMPIRKLIAGGFEFTGRDEQVTCSTCHLTIDCWKDTDIPLKEHHRKSPTCRRLAQLPPPSQLSNCTFPNSASNYVSENTGITTESQKSPHVVTEKINKSETKTASLDVKSIDRTNPDFGSLKLEKVRLETYFDWPQSSKVDRAVLARDGFFFIGERDKVQCAFCRGVLFNWLEGDHPQTEHRKHFPNCHFVRGRNVGNVRLEVYEDAEWTLRSNSPCCDPVSEPATVKVQMQMNPVKEAKDEFVSRSPASNASIIDRTLECIPARAVLSMGYSKQVVQQAINNQLSNQGVNFESAEELLDSIISSESESREAMIPFTSNTSRLSVVPNRMSSSDEELSLEEITRTVSESNELVQITPENCLDRSTLRLNEEQLENLQITVGLPNADESTTIGGLRQKKKKRKRKAKIFTENQNAKEPNSENVQKSSKLKESKTIQQSDKSRSSEMSETSVASPEDLQLIAENKVLRDAKTCKVCMDKEVNTVFLPCGHLVCCNECAANIHNCAICRTLIRGTVRIFLS